MKRKGRESTGSLMLKNHLAQSSVVQQRALQILEADSSKLDESTKFTVGAAVGELNRMVDVGLMTEAGDLWVNMNSEISKKLHKRHCFNLLLGSCYTNDLAATYYYKYIYKEPCMTSSLTGEAWVMEVLNGHPIRCVNAFRMHPDLFRKLCGELETNYGLQSSDKMSTFEMVGIFMYTLALGLSNRDVMERFQRSGETISRAFHEVLNAIIGRDKGFQGLARDIIRPKDPTFQLIPPQIINDKRYMPYFKNCIGCIDGTHIRACITESQQLPYIGRKGVPTFNVMATISRQKWNLVPYPKTRYHQFQFQRESPNNMQEAFNRSHSSLRSYIERSFGILKKRCRILREMPTFSVQTQIDVITATFALHNYIRTNSQEDILFAIIDQHPNYIPRDELIDVSNRDRSAEGLYEGRSNEMKHVRNDIATLIWNARRK
ncbi:uncharacterized protein [Rutidosis leptorrhynchoides]|uniref:uncharacterized protein n=1 Tax=Rutidosis leptorrhynchoides TaxID=125765 RepID=UPI003A9980B9